MRPFRKKIVISAAVLVLAVTGVTGCKASDDAVVAEVGNEEIPFGVANFYARMQQAQYETYYAGMMGTTPEAMWTQESGEDKTYEETTKESILKNLEDMYLLSQHMEEYDISITEEDKKAIAKAAGIFDEDNSLEDKEMVSGYKKNVEKILQLATIQTRMKEAMTADVDTEVSDEEAAQKSMQYVYFSYTTTDESGNSVTLTDEEKEALKTTAQEFVDNLNADETRNIDTAAANAGLEVQTATFDSESTSPNADLVAAADALEKEGEIAGPVVTDSGIYVAKLTSLLDREATDAKKTSIVEERKEEQYDKLLEKWRNDTEIKVHKNVWKKVDFENQGVTILESPDEYTDETTEE